MSSTSSSASGAPEQPDRRGIVVTARAALVAAAVLVAAGIVVVVLVLGPGAGRAGPPDDLARLAPPDVRLWFDAAPHDADAARAWTLATRFPALRAAPAALAARLGLRGFEPARDLRAWLGDELGVAVLPDGAPLVLAAVRDAAAARAVLARLGARPAGRAGNASLFGTGRALVALTGDRLAAGPAAAVRAAIGRTGGGLDSVATYRRAAGEREAGVAAVYAPADGVRRLLGAADPLVRAGATLLDSPGLQAVAAEAAPEDGGMRIHGHVLRGSGVPASIAPTLLGRVPASSAALLLLPSGEALASLVGRLGGAALVDGVRSALATEASLDLDRDLLAPLRETAVTLQARGNVPVAALAARSLDPATTREALARAQGPLATRLTGGASQAFRPMRRGGFTLPVTPTLQPSYAVDGDVLVAGTAQPALDERRLAASGIARVPALAQALSGREGSVQALGFLDLRQLLGLGERTGLASTAGFQAVSGDLGPVRTAGAVLGQDTDHPTDTTAELFLEIP